MLEILANKLKLQNVKMKSDSLMSSCPFAKWKHAKKSDSRPSFSLCVKDTGMVVYSCFACGSRGTAKDLAAKLFELNKDPEMLDVIAYIEEHMKFDLDNVIHVKKEEPIFLDEEVHGELCPLVTDHREGLQYCLSRGISKETCERLDLRYHPEDRRVIFKVYDYSGRLLGMSGRSTDPNNNLKILTIFPY